MSNINPSKSDHHTSDLPQACGNKVSNSCSASDNTHESVDNESRLQVNKLQSEIDKISLEKKYLTHQLSWQGVALEWAKAGAVFAALIGIATTLYLGQEQARLAQLAASNQIAQAQESRAADRFDKALGRLADRDNAGARLTGVAGLRLFLTDGVYQHQREAAHYLVTAIAQEKSPEIRQAVVDAFTEAKNFTQEAKDEALRTAIELNRTLTKASFNQIWEAKNGDVRRLLASFLHKPLDELPEDIFTFYLQSRDSLSFLHKMQILSTYGTPIFHDPTTRNKSRFIPEVATLDNYVDLINLLISAGAKNTTNDWSELYCQACDFTDAGDLSGANFNGSFLSAADFSHTKLRKSTFRDADLGEAIFFASDLSDADLSWRTGTNAVKNALRIRLATFPYLECATLSGADLTNLPLGSLSILLTSKTDSSSNPFISALMSNMTFVKFDENTNIAKLNIRLGVTIYEEYYSALPYEQKRELESNFGSDNFRLVSLFAEFDSNLSIEELSLTATGRIGYLRTDRFVKLTRTLGDAPRRFFAKILNQPIWRAKLLTPKQGDESVTNSGVQTDEAAREKYCSQSTPDPLNKMHVEVSGLLHSLDR